MCAASTITVLLLGDVIGKPGRHVVKHYLQNLSVKPDLVVANVENSAHGYGTTEDNLNELREAGVNAFTGGNHTFDRKEIFQYIDGQEMFLRPANYPEGTPGKGYCLIDVKGHKLGLLNLLGRVFMEPMLSPFVKADELVALMRKQTNLIVVDIHAEATAEKVALGWYLDGRVCAVVGSHTHVQTADERILTNGTAYITDMGCCGPYNSVIGMQLDTVFRRLVQQLPSRFEVASGPAMLNGVLLTIDTCEGKALSIERVRYVEDSG
jgi:metallophosphoesterase (TIGR00282 family)